MVVFDGVHYSLSPSLSQTRKQELASLLDINGASSFPPYTHLIALAGSHAHNDVDQSNTSLKVVSDRWVDRSVVMGKIQPEQYYSPDPAMIFSGVVACATDLSAADLEVLSAGITALGGQWRIGLTRDVTHLFALRPGSDKYNTALHFAPQTHMCILTPHWFDDSVRLGRRLPETPYSWPDPPVLRPGATLEIEDDPNMTDNKRRRKSGVDGEGGTEAGQSTGNEGEKVKVWGGRRILLSYSLELSARSREAMEAGIRRAGGVVVAIPGDADDGVEEKAVDECDVLITRWRSGKAYFKAAHASLLIGTLSWLLSVESSGTLYSPLDSLLWYPVPRGGVPGLVDAEICLTNYTGAARDYLKRLISLMGAKFTPSMTIGNKVLVAGFQPSPKTTRALAWSIPVVNHTWLEDCFVEWRALTVGLERYIVYPPGIDFGKMLMTRSSETSASSNASVPLLSGGAVPGGRGIGVIDLEYEETRDADYRETEVAENITATRDAAVAEGDRGRSRRDEEPTSAKQSKPAPRARSRSAKATPSTKSNRESALGAFIDQVIEIPDDDGANERGGPRDAPNGKKAKSNSTPKATGKPRSVSKRTPSVPLPGTSASAMDAREVEEAVTLDQDIEEQGEAEPSKGDLAPEDDAEDDDQVARRAKSKVTAKDKGKSKSGGVNTDASDKEKAKSTSKSKAASARPRSPSRESSPAPQAVKYPSPYRPKPRLVRRSLASSTARRSDVESEDEVQEVVPSKKDQGPSTSKVESSTSKARQKGKSTSVGSDSDSEGSAPPRRAAGQTSTPVKSGMKPKPKANGKATEAVGEESEDEDRSRPAPTKTKEKRKEKGQSGTTARNDDSGKHVTEKAAQKKAAPHSPTRSPSPTPITKSSRSPKRRLSVVIPSVPKDYFSQSSTREAASSPSEPKQKVARTASIRATAAEASTSASKRAKPSPAKLLVASGKTKPSAPKTKAVRPTESEHEDEDETSMVVDSPMTSTSRGGPRRSAASKASTKLRDVVMPDVINFEKERKNEKRRRSMGGESVISTKDDEKEDERGAKRRKLDKSGSKENVKGKAKKVARDEEEEEEEEEAEVEDVVLVSQQKAKATKGKASAEPDDEVDDRPGKSKAHGSQEKKKGTRKSEPSRGRSTIRLMTTGVSLSDDVVKRLTKLGIQMTTKPTDCTHLIAKGIVRTEKFLCAMAVSPYILTEEWANVSAKANKLLPESEYLLSDPAAEQKWGFELTEAMERSKGSEGGSNLFKQMTFYVTPKVSVDTKLLKNVVLAGGGQVQTSNPTVRILKGKENRYAVSCPEDKSIWRPLAQEGFTIYSTELILQAALKQKIEWQNKECIVAG